MPKSKSSSQRAMGRLYNLQKIFRRLNGLYFGGAIKARVEWGRTRATKARRSREFGTYYFKERLIRIHPILDQAWVPLHVIESVMHHEMCHQMCLSDFKNGRRISHSKQFRQLERRYAYFCESEKWMKENLKKLMGRAPSPAKRLEKSKSCQLTLALAA